MLSALITVPRNSSAIASASPDLPLAVGPPMRMRGGLMPSVLTQRRLPFAALAFAALAFAAGLADNRRVDAVLTLIAADELARPDMARRLDDAVAALRDRLHALGADVGRAEWLSPGRACDLFHDGLDNDLADAGARQILASDFASLTVDIVVQPCHERRKTLLVADMESTIIENEMLDELADFLGLREEVAEVT